MAKKIISKTAIASAEFRRRGVQLVTKNADAPEGKMWSLEASDYVDQPTCDPGYHWDMNLYKCVPD